MQYNNGKAVDILIFLVLIFSYSRFRKLKCVSWGHWRSKSSGILIWDCFSHIKMSNFALEREETMGIRKQTCITQGKIHRDAWFTHLALVRWFSLWNWHKSVQKNHSRTHVRVNILVEGSWALPSGEPHFFQTSFFLWTCIGCLFLVIILYGGSLQLLKRKLKFKQKHKED